MSARERHLPPTEPKAFLAWENRQRQRYELVNGVVRLMTGGTAGHNRIAVRIAARLERRLAGGDCAVHQNDLKVVSPTGLVTYPDVMVRCGGFDEDATEVDDPVLVVEVLSPGTRGKDLIGKRYAYQAIPSLRWLVYVEPKKVQVEVVSREPDGSWRGVFLTRLDDMLRIEPLGIEIGLAEIYAGLGAAGG